LHEKPDVPTVYNDVAFIRLVLHPDIESNAPTSTNGSYMLRATSRLASRPIDRSFGGCQRCFRGNIDLSPSLPSREIVHRRGELGRILIVKPRDFLPGLSGSAPVLWGGW
jgi:hypothetical protein